MKKMFLFFSSLLILSMALNACAPVATATSAPTTEAPTMEAATATTESATQPSTEAATTPTSEATAAATETTAPSSAPVATIPPDKLGQKEHLLICTDFPYPPQEFFDEKGEPQGLDVEIGTEIANRLGLKVQFVNSVFDTIIAAVKSGKCDIVISAQNITSDRQKEVSMIPYFQAGQSFVAVKGNPDNINGPMDLCGKSAAAESGTTEADFIGGTGDYKGKGMTDECTKAGKQPINLVVTQKDTDALQQLQAGKVSVYFADSPVAAFYTVEHPDQFQLVGEVLDPVQEGISVPCGVDDCTNAPLTEVGQAVQSALKSMMDDGTYAKILEKWNLKDGAVTLP
jgi:polar amino acid transport system substrate-binding protein